MTKILWVVAGALITPDNNVLLSQRPKGKHLEGLWEYPGGKIEAGETPEQALCRELKEELNITISPTDLKTLTFASFAYGEFHLVMPLFICEKWQGTPTPLEGQNITFHPINNVGLETSTYPMPPADDVLSQALRQWKKDTK